LGENFLGGKRRETEEFRAWQGIIRLYITPVAHLKYSQRRRKKRERKVKKIFQRVLRLPVRNKRENNNKEKRVPVEENLVGGQQRKRSIQ